MATLSMDNSNIIGISYSQMNSVKVSMKRAQQMLETSQRNLSTARVQLQADRGRLRITEDSLSNLYSEASKRKTKIDKICNNIDYTIRRFKEVDSRCAASIRSIAKYYNSQVSIVDRIKNSILGIGKYLFNGFTSLLEEGANAFDFLKTKASEAYNAVSEFMEAHPWIGNTLGVIGGIGQMGVYALLLTPPFTPIGVAGMAFGFNSAVYSGTKLINNITNGSNEGTNALKSIFSLFGDGGETAYDVLDMGFAVATIPIEGGFALSKASQIVKESNGAIKGFSALSKGIKEVEKMKVDKLSNILSSTLGKIIEPMSKVKVYFKNSFGEFFNFKSLAFPEGFSINISKIDDASDSSKVVNKIGQISEDIGDYGKVTEGVSNTNPSEIAQSWQGGFPYIGVDKYKNITLKKGKVIYVGDPYPTGYATTKSALDRIDGDARKLFEGLQVKPYWEDGMSAAEYRGKMMAYEVTEEIDVAFGITKANPQFGEGGLPQMFIPDFNNLLKSGAIKKVELKAVELNNYKMSLDDYNKMLDILEGLK